MCLGETRPIRLRKKDHIIAWKVVQRYGGKLYGFIFDEVIYEKYNDATKHRIPYCVIYSDRNVGVFSCYETSVQARRIAMKYGCSHMVARVKLSGNLVRDEHGEVAGRFMEILNYDELIN